MAHDPPTAWLIVLAYFLGAAVCVAAARSGDKRERSFWFVAAAALFLLGVNKQLDLQMLVTEAGRELAHSQGWYEKRRLAQGLFLLVLAIAAFVASLILAAWLRRARASVQWGAAGLVVLTLFIFFRAATVHHIDQWVTLDIAGMRSGRWLELIGIAIVAVAAGTFLRAPAPKRRRRRRS